ncbi:MAG: single-stranded DNA-binding protein [Acidobacteria bacterium]|nr:single-stranded DNA-binding protein [Acidobacteriota bacterium]
MNRAILIGYLGKDAEVRSTTNNASFTVLSLATKRSWKDRKSGEYKSQTTWHRCVVWGKLGDYAAKLTKGTHVQLEGEIRSRQFAVKVGKKQADVRKTITEVRVTSINKLDRAARAAAPEAQGEAA